MNSFSWRSPPTTQLGIAVDLLHPIQDPNQCKTAMSTHSMVVYIMGTKRLNQMLLKTEGQGSTNMIFAKRNHQWLFPNQGSFHTGDEAHYLQTNQQIDIHHPKPRIQKYSCGEAANVHFIWMGMRSLAFCRLAIDGQLSLT